MSRLQLNLNNNQCVLLLPIQCWTKHAQNKITEYMQCTTNKVHVFQWLNWHSEACLRWNDMFEMDCGLSTLASHKSKYFGRDTIAEWRSAQTTIIGQYGHCGYSSSPAISVRVEFDYPALWDANLSCLWPSNYIQAKAGNWQHLSARCNVVWKGHGIRLHTLVNCTRTPTQFEMCPYPLVLNKVLSDIVRVIASASESTRSSVGKGSG